MQYKPFLFSLSFLFACGLSTVMAQQHKTTKPSRSTVNIDVLDEADSVDTSLPDSLRELEERRFEDLNSGRAVVEESEVLKMFDTLGYIKYFGDKYLDIDRNALNVYGYSYDEVPVFDDSVYMQRIDALARETTMPLVFNAHVKSFIDLYANRKRNLTSRVLGLSHLYFPMFEELLDKYNMPLELKYLAVVESALNATAGSKAGAKGLWQFMYNTGKVYGLQVSSLVDDRYDPVKETEAACQHLQDLYQMYGDWFLALAAYNSGAGNVNKALVKAGGVRDYWAIWPYLPRETRGYVPAFIAVVYVMNHAAEHNLYPLDPGLLLHGTDTVTVRDYLDFAQINEMLGAPLADIEFFNPQFVKNIIPASPEKTYSLRLPTKYALAFVQNEDSIYSFKTRAGLNREKLADKVKLVSDRSVHVVHKGESLGTIARKYQVSVANLKRWNGLRRETIQPGQRLVVYSSGAPMAQAGDKAPVMRSTSQKTHVVKAGESLGSISKKYRCTVTDLKEWNNLRKNTIYTGQKLKVFPPAQGSEQANTKKSGGYVYYTVKSGETLWSIAEKFDGVTVNQIKKLNGLGSKGAIRAGQKLKIQKL